VTAKDPSGKVVLSESKVFMPVPHQLGIGDRMGRGPYDKSELLVKWGLHPLEEKKEEFRILLPAKDKKPESLEYTLKVELWYFPFGKKDEYAQLWKKEVKKVRFSDKEPYPGA
jgi:hypothetical protein